jgi:hypothetical protein
VEVTMTRTIMAPRSAPLGLATALLLGACGGDDPVNDRELTLRTGEFTVGIGDSFTCFYTDVFTDRELSVTGAAGGQGNGGHHIIAYYADTPRPVGNHPCTDEEMANLRQIAGSAGDGGAGPLSLGEGLAIKVPVGKQLVMQAHYINTTDAPEVVDDWVTLQLAKPEEVFSYVNYFVTNDDTFEIPPTAAYTHTTYCTLDRDLDVILTLGHMHEVGEHYQLEIVDAPAGAAAAPQVLRSDAWEPLFTSHPPMTRYPVTAPLHLAAGTRLKQTCDWSNTGDHTVLFPREMCLSFMYYFPGDGDLVCDMTAQ